MKFRTSFPQAPSTLLQLKIALIKNKIEHIPSLLWHLEKLVPRQLIIICERHPRVFVGKKREYERFQSGNQVKHERYSPETVPDYFRASVVGCLLELNAKAPRLYPSSPSPSLSSKLCTTANYRGLREA
jgi:hypothetical protein